MQRKLILFGAPILIAILIACTGGGGIPINCQIINGQLICTPPASPVPTVEPPPESPRPSPLPSPPASPRPSPTPTPVPTPTPRPSPSPSASPCVVASPDAPDRTCPRAPYKMEDLPGCDTCANWRSYNKDRGHWIDEGRRDGWYRANGIGSPDGDKFVTKECDLVWEGGSLFATRESGRLGNICPRMDAVCPRTSRLRTATNCPSPSPAPTPSPSPSPGQCVPPTTRTESGNFPLPAAGTCPCWFQGKTTFVKAKVFKPVKCGDGNNCWRYNITATETTTTPYLEHTCYDEEGRYALSNCKTEGEVWRPCQQPQFIDYVGEGPNPGNGIVMEIAHPSWGNIFGRCDKRTCDTRLDACPIGMSNPVHNSNCHDKAVDRVGKTRVRTCMPDGTRCSEAMYGDGSN